MSNVLEQRKKSFAHSESFLRNEICQFVPVFTSMHEIGWVTVGGGGLDLSPWINHTRGLKTSMVLIPFHRFNLWFSERGGERGKSEIGKIVISRFFALLPCCFFIEIIERQFSSCVIYKSMFPSAPTPSLTSVREREEKSPESCSLLFSSSFLEPFLSIFFWAWLRWK